MGCWNQQQKSASLVAKLGGCGSLVSCDAERGAVDFNLQGRFRPFTRQTVAHRNASRPKPVSSQAHSTQSEQPRLNGGNFRLPQNDRSRSVLHGACNKVPLRRKTSLNSKVLVEQSSPRKYQPVSCVGSANRLYVQGFCRLESQARNRKACPQHTSL